MVIWLMMSETILVLHLTEIFAIQTIFILSIREMQTSYENRKSENC